MEDMKLYCLIYELKGIVDSLTELSSYEPEFDHPLTETVEAKTNDIIDHIEGQKTIHTRAIEQN